MLRPPRERPTACFCSPANYVLGVNQSTVKAARSNFTEDGTVRHRFFCNHTRCHSESRDRLSQLNMSCFTLSRMGPW